MLFNSVEFLFGYLPVVLCGFFGLGRYGYRQLALAWLVLASLFFYGWWNVDYLGLILGSILFNYAIGFKISQPESLLFWYCKIEKKQLLVLSIAFNLCLLGYFKYADFLIDNINVLMGTELGYPPVELPLAISFFTLQQIMYLVDSYKNDVYDRSFLRYCVFITFFPQLIAGPIVQHKEILPQLDKEAIYRPHKIYLVDGITIILIGLFKKVVLADSAAVYATPVFSAAEAGYTLTFFEAWGGALSYTFQIYFDFSSYSDMAIGLARLFGIQLPINFHSPYKSTSMIEFWRRWHMTLSRFLHDYVYIPLGGGHKGKWRRYINLMTTMLLAGLWHGAHWTFVAWGALHGLFLIINHGWRALCQRTFGNAAWQSGTIWRWLSRLLTFNAFLISTVFFKAESFNGALAILAGMSGLNGVVLPAQIVAFIPGLEHFVEAVGVMPLLGGGKIMGVLEMAGLLGLMAVLVFAAPATHEMTPRQKYWAIVLSFSLSMQALFISPVTAEFIYFQF